MNFKVSYFASYILLLTSRHSLKKEAKKYKNLSRGIALLCHDATKSYLSWKEFHLKRRPAFTAH